MRVCDRGPPPGPLKAVERTKDQARERHMCVLHPCSTLFFFSFNASEKLQLHRHRPPMSTHTHIRARSHPAFFLLPISQSSLYCLLLHRILRSSGQQANARACVCVSTSSVFDNGPVRQGVRNAHTYITSHARLCGLSTSSLLIHHTAAAAAAAAT